MAEAEGRQLQAEATVRLPDPESHLGRLCGYFAEYGETDCREGAGRIALVFGRVRLEAWGESLLLQLAAPDATGLAFLKQAMAEQLIALSPDRPPQITWEGDGPAGGLPPYFREMRVVASRRLTPRMQRVTLAGEDLARFASGGLHVRLLFPPRGASRPLWPTLGADGRLVWPDGEASLVARVYTIRRVDPRTGLVVVDMVLHEGPEVPGASWARSAKAGVRVGMTGPGGGTVGEALDYLLVGDETALPAIGRILEELPPQARVRALIEVADADERQPLRSAARLELRWLERGGRPAGSTTLLADAVQELEAPAQGAGFFAWAGGEQAAIAAIRDHWRGVWQLDRRRHLAAAYWQREA